jgi:hypothetical protein
MALTADQVIAKDLANLQMLGAWVEAVQLNGSFSARRPDLGKMINCPACKHRHRMIGPRCSNAAFATTQRAWNPEEGFHQVACEPREVDAMFGKAMFRKFKHKRHGQSKRNAVRVLTLELQNDAEKLKAAVEEMHRAFAIVKMPAVAEIPAFAVRYFMWREDREQKRERKQRDISNRINRGQAKVGSRYHASNHSRLYESPLTPSPEVGHVVEARMPEQGPVSESA